MQTLSIRFGMAKTSINLQTIGELDQIKDNRNQKSSIEDQFQSPRLLKTKSAIEDTQMSIFESPNQALLKKAQKNPFLMKKIQLTLKKQLKRQSFQDFDFKYGDNIQKRKQTSFREYARMKERNEQIKLNELNQYLKVKA